MEQAAVYTKTVPEKLDPIDRQILNILQEDCRLSFSKVANKAGISVGTAYNRIKSLEAKGVLKGYTALIDSTKMGYSLTAIILLQAEGGHLTEAETAIAKAASVIAVYDVTGDFDAVIIAKFKDRNSLNTFLKHLSTTPFVKRTATNVALTMVKEDFRLKL